MGRISNMTVIDGGDGVPPEPDWQLIYNDTTRRELAHQHWQNIVREMRSAWTISAGVGNAIARLVAFRLEYDRAAEHVGQHGAILPPRNCKTAVGVWNPHWSVMRQADEAARQLESELGLSPSKRHKAGKVQRRPRGPRASDGYLRPVSPSNGDTDEHR